MTTYSETTSTRSEQPIRFAGAMLGEYRHVCAFFQSADEEYRTLLPFIQEGLERGEKVFHIVDPKLHQDHLQRLESSGIDTAATQGSGQLEVHDWYETYLRDGRFDKDRMLNFIPQASEQARQQGYSLIRILGHAEWSGERWPNDFLEYEARLNDVVPRLNGPVICLYDLARMDGGIIVDVMRTHPMIVLGGVLHENPFFVAPDEFLREFRDRETVYS